jgi:hypothetical protein
LIGAIAALSVKEMKIRNFDVWKAVILGIAIETKGISNAAAKKHFRGTNPARPTAAASRLYPSRLNPGAACPGCRTVAS